VLDVHCGVADVTTSFRSQNQTAGFSVRPLQTIVNRCYETPDAYPKYTRHARPLSEASTSKISCVMRATISDGDHREGVCSKISGQHLASVGGAEVTAQEGYYLYFELILDCVSEDYKAKMSSYSEWSSLSFGLNIFQFNISKCIQLTSVIIGLLAKQFDASNARYKSIQSENQICGEAELIR
jgi:hypothetical protein